MDEETPQDIYCKIGLKISLDALLGALENQELLEQEDNEDGQ